jgi:hypothetical protein
MNNDEINLIMKMLENIYLQNKGLEEKIECILHTICKNDDDKTKNSIGKYLISEFRNRNN